MLSHRLLACCYASLRQMVKLCYQWLYDGFDDSKVAHSKLKGASEVPTLHAITQEKNNILRAPQLIGEVALHQETAGLLYGAHVNVAPVQGTCQQAFRVHSPCIMSAASTSFIGSSSCKIQENCSFWLLQFLTPHQVPQQASVWKGSFMPL
jgi:hypothetical protein